MTMKTYVNDDNDDNNNAATSTKADMYLTSGEERHGGFGPFYVNISI